jgi:hypothetical protein
MPTPRPANKVAAQLQRDPVNPGLVAIYSKSQYNHRDFVIGDIGLQADVAVDAKATATYDGTADRAP